MERIDEDDWQIRTRGAAQQHIRYRKRANLLHETN